MNAAVVLVKKLFGLIFGIFSCIKRLYRRVICRSGLGRKMSGSLLPFTTDQIAAVGEVQQSLPSNNIELESWDSWGPEDDRAFNPGAGNMASNGPMMGHQRERRGSTRSHESESDPDVDYFQDMQPEIRKSAKILVRKREEDFSKGGLSSRLTLKTDLPPQDGELGTWEETESAWSGEAMEDLTWEAESTLRAKRKLEREERRRSQEQKKRERDATRHVGQGGIAVKLS